MSSVHVFHQNLFRHFTEEPIPESGTQCNDALVTNLMGIPHVEQDSFSYSKSPPLELEGTLSRCATKHYNYNFIQQVTLSA